MSDPKREVSITLDELRTLTSSAIADIHGEVDEIFADGLSRCGKENWSAAALRTELHAVAALFERAIELCEELETRAFSPSEEEGS